MLKLMEYGSIQARIPHILAMAGVPLLGGVLVLGSCWYSPEELYGGPHLERIEKRGRNCILYLKPSSSLSDIAALDIFEGFSPSTTSEFEETLEGRPSRYVKNSDHHHYVEYVWKYGRAQLHTELDADGIRQWIEFLPTDLGVDAFLSEDVAIHVDFSEAESRIYIPPKTLGTYMTIIVKNRKIDRIIWSDY